MSLNEQRSATPQRGEKDFGGESHINTYAPIDAARAAGDGVFPRSVELHVEELVMRGFEAGDRYRIGDAVQRELARLFGEGGARPSLAQGGEAAMIDAGEFVVEQGATPEAIGAQVARAVFERLSK